jgi:hypothetical protein
MDFTKMLHKFTVVPTLTEELAALLPIFEMNQLIK